MSGSASWRNRLTLLAWALLPAYAPATVVLALLLAASRLRWPLQVRLPRPPRWLLIAIALLAGSTLLAPKSFLPFTNPALRSNVSKNLILQSERIATWNSTFDRAGQVAAPSRGASADCIVIPPVRALTHTVSVEPQASLLTASIYARLEPSADASLREVRLRLGPPGAGGVEATKELGSAWERVSATYLRSGSEERVSLVLFNASRSEPLSLCLWGAQLERGADATSYQSVKASLGELESSPLLRLASAAALAVTLLAAWLLTRLFRTTLIIVSVQAAGTALLIGIGAVLLLLVGQSLLLPGQPVGPGAHQNITGAQLTLAFALLALIAPPGGRRAVLFGGLLALVAVLLTGSRTATAALLGAGVIGLWLNLEARGRRARWALLAIALAAIVISGLLLVRGVHGWDSSRSAIYPAAVSAWLASPITGWGTSSASIALTEHATSLMSEVSAHAHNAFLQVLIEHGLLGFAALAIAVAALVDLLRRNPEGAPFALALLMLGTLDLTFTNATVYPLILVALAVLTARFQAMDRVRQPAVPEVKPQVGLRRDQ